MNPLLVRLPPALRERQCRLTLKPQKLARELLGLPLATPVRRTRLTPRLPQLVALQRAT